LPNSARFSRRCRYGNKILFLGEIFIVKDVRRGADQLESHLHVALIADGKQVVAIHNGFMRLAMPLVVDDLVDSTFQHGLPGQEHLGMLCGLAAMAPLFVSAGHQGPVDFLATSGFGYLDSVHFGCNSNRRLQFLVRKIIFSQAWRLNRMVASIIQI